MLLMVSILAPQILKSMISIEYYSLIKGLGVAVICNKYLKKGTDRIMGCDRRAQQAIDKTFPDCSSTLPGWTKPICLMTTVGNRQAYSEMWY